MKDPIRRIFYLLGIAALSMLFDVLFEQYNTLQLYWIIRACLDLLFWVLALYPNYRWRFMGLFRRIIVSGVCIRFCTYFLPVVILLSEPYQHFEKWLNLVMVLAIIWDNDDRGGGKGKRTKDTEEEVDSNRLATDNI
jgi:hypothetical protein